MNTQLSPTFTTKAMMEIYSPMRAVSTLRMEAIITWVMQKKM